jgi:methionine synthase II (cobalamin-independent)
MLHPRDDDDLGVAVEKGIGILLGVLPTSGPLPSVQRAVESVGRLRDRVGLTNVTVTPACGLAGCTWDEVKAITKRLAEVAQALEER